MTEFYNHYANTYRSENASLLFNKMVLKLNSMIGGDFLKIGTEPIKIEQNNYSENENFAKSKVLFSFSHGKQT